MRLFRILLSLVLSLAVPYSALAGALHDPRCGEPHAVISNAGMAQAGHHEHVHDRAMTDNAMPMSADGSMVALMDMDALPPDAPAPHTHGHASGSAGGSPCHCPFAAACLAHGAGSGCGVAFDPMTRAGLTALRQEQPAPVAASALLPAALAEPLRPPIAAA